MRGGNILPSTLLGKNDMKKFVCIRDRVFFNKRIYNYGDSVNMDDELAERANPKLFEPVEDFEKKQEVVVKKVKKAKAEGKTVKEVIAEAEAEKAEMEKKHKAEIQHLEKQLNPKVKNGI